MKKFKFSLDKLLTQRQISQDLAQKEFVDAKSLLETEIDKLNEMISVKERTLSERSKVVETTTDWANSVNQMNIFLQGQDLRISRQHERIKEVENIVESRREILRQAVSEVKILERLEEKQRVAHTREFRKLEQAEIDELTVLRFSRNGNLIKGSHEDGI